MAQAGLSRGRQRPQHLSLASLSRHCVRPHHRAMFDATKLSYQDAHHPGMATSAYVSMGGHTNNAQQQQQQNGAQPQQPLGLLPGRVGGAQPDGAHSLALRPAENVPVYVMLPLDTVNADGVFKYAYVPWFAQALQVLALSGVHGVAVDVWWCAIERAPRQYVWTGYKQLFEMVRACGLKLQVVLSFHACGGNVGDMVQVPLPAWVLQAGLSDPDIFFTDRPRESGLGQRNKEYLSIWADDCPVLPAGPHQPPRGSAAAAAAAAGSGGGVSFSSGGRGSGGGIGSGSGGGGGGGNNNMRTPLQCYEEFMVAFRDEFAQQLGSLIEEVVVGSGPCGELRYPSYVEANGWRFPGVGEFQCYDRRALASLAAAAEAAGHPEWGYAGPHDSGGYNSLPLDTDFFKPHGGSWDTDYGNFFLSWYSSCLLQHGERLLQLADQVFAPHRPKPRMGLLAHAQAVLRQLQQLLGGGGGSSGGSDGGGIGVISSSTPDSEWGVAAAAAAAAVAAAAGTPGMVAAAAAATTEGAVQQALLLLQQLLSCGGAAMAAAAAGTAGTAGNGNSSGSMSGSSGSSSPLLQLAAGSALGVPSHRPSCDGSRGGEQMAMGYSSRCPTHPVAASHQHSLLTNGAAAAAAAVTAAAGAAVVSASLPHDALELAGSLLQQLLPHSAFVPTDVSSSLHLTAAGGAMTTDSMVGQLQLLHNGSGSGSLSSPGVAAAVAAAAAAACGAAATTAPEGGSSANSSTVASPIPAAGCGVTTAAAAAAGAEVAALAPLGSGDCTSVSMPTASSLQSSSSALDLSTADLLSASQQHLAGLSLNHSSSSPQQQQQHHQPLQAAGVAQLLQPASAASVNAACNGATATTTPAAATAARVSNSALAAAGAGSSSTSSMECSGTSSSPSSSSAGPFSGCGSSVSSLAAAALALPTPPAASAAGDSNSLLQLFLQLLSGLGFAPAQAQQQQQQQPHHQSQQQQQQHQRRPKGLVLSLKIAGVHWWYNSTSHASELTAGYYNTDTRDGYSPILALCERYNVNLTITCVEMCDAQHPSYALCGPEGLLRQIRAMAAHRNVTLSGENALPIFTPGGIDGTALDRVVSNVRACRNASLRSCSSWPGPRSSSGGGGGGGGGHGVNGSSSSYMMQQHGGWEPLQYQQQPWGAAGATGAGATGFADGMHKQQLHTGGSDWQQHQRLLQQQQHHQQMLWYGADRMGSHQHTTSGHITSNSRNFSELGTLLQVYGSGGGGGSSMSAAAGASSAAFYGGTWQQQQQQRDGGSTMLGGRNSPNSDGSNGGGGSHSQQQHGRLHGSSKGGGGADAELLPAMRAFTFLRLGPEILQPECHTSWMRFMHRMLNERA